MEDQRMISPRTVLFAAIVFLAMVSAHAVKAEPGDPNTCGLIVTRSGGSLCAEGGAQALPCLQANGAIGADGAVVVERARDLLANGTCPCVANGTAAASTPPTAPGRFIKPQSRLPNPTPTLNPPIALPH
jgi:hypothetical protein